MTSSEGRTLIVGEALVDIVDGGRSTAPTEFVGGSPANVAVGLARLGRPTDFLASLARDDRGERIAAHLGASGVTVLAATWTAPRTPTALAEVGHDGSARYTFDIEWDLPVPVDMRSYSAVHTGSIAAFLEPGATAVRVLLESARAGGALVTFDPNIRAALLPSRDVAVERFESIARLSHVVKMSDEDARWLYPGLADDDVVATVISLGVNVVAVTAGGEGAVVATTTHRVSVPAVEANVIDTIGAGDSFMAALIAQTFDIFASGGQSGLLALHEVRLLEIGMFCARASAITVSRAGANPPTAADLAQ